MFTLHDSKFFSQFLSAKFGKLSLFTPRKNVPLSGKVSESWCKVKHDICLWSMQPHRHILLGSEFQARKRYFRQAAHNQPLRGLSWTSQWIRYVEFIRWIFKFQCHAFKCFKYWVVKYHCVNSPNETIQETQSKRKSPSVWLHLMEWTHYYEISKKFTWKSRREGSFRNFPGNSPTVRIAHSKTYHFIAILAKTTISNTRNDISSTKASLSFLKALACVSSPKRWK